MKNRSMVLTSALGSAAILSSVVIGVAYGSTIENQQQCH